MIRCAEAILASSTSKCGIEIPRIYDEDFKSFTESTNSTSLIHSIASVGNCEQIHRWRWLNFWLTVQTGISDLDLVLARHFSPLWINGAALRSMNSIAAILEDKVLMMTHLDLLNVSRYTVCVPNAWRPFSAARRYERMSQHPFRYWMRWEWHRSTGNVRISTAYWFSILKMFWIVRTIYFILQFLCSARKFQANVVGVENLSKWSSEICRSAVVVGLPHNSSRVFLPQGRMYFRLTVLSEISESRLCLESGVHYR